MNYVTSTYVSRVGRLGNSLLQIASALAYGADNNKRAVFDKWDYQEYIPLDMDFPKDVTWHRVAHNNASYVPLEVLDGNVDIHGHMMSEKFFSHQRELILKTIKLKDEYEHYIEQKYGDLIKGESCAIHIRRGDYLQEEQSKFHGVLPFSYYVAALSIISKWHPLTSKWIFFSDDIGWCRESFNLPTATFMQEEKDIIDLFIMSKCKYQIIANSTFSWWAAWLCQREGNKVIAPSNWFYNTPGWDDLYRENWIRI